MTLCPFNTHLWQMHLKVVPINCCSKAFRSFKVNWLKTKWPFKEWILSYKILTCFVESWVFELLSIKRGTLVRPFFFWSLVHFAVALIWLLWPLNGNYGKLYSFKKTPYFTNQNITHWWGILDWPISTFTHAFHDLDSRLLDLAFTAGSYSPYLLMHKLSDVFSINWEIEKLKVVRNFRWKWSCLIVLVAVWVTTCPSNWTLVNWEVMCLVPMLLPSRGVEQKIVLSRLIVALYSIFSSSTFFALDSFVFGIVLSWYDNSWPYVGDSDSILPFPPATLLSPCVSSRPPGKIVSVWMIS